MATEAGSSARVGPVPFKDVEDDSDTVTAVPERPSEEHVGLLRCYQGFWLREGLVPAAAALQRRFEPRPSDVIVASLPKCGTTWLVALAFATLARHAHPPAAADHPLRRLNPHQCLPFLEGLFAGGREGKLDALPSPRLMNTHMPLAMIPGAVPAGGGCKVVYICREPKDMVVSLWHYLRRVHPDLEFSEVFDMACDGTTPWGPFWDHFLGYWRASAARPESVLFLRYEELLRDPAGNLRRLARFVGLPFSAAEEEGGVVGGIVELCSLDSLRGMEANKAGYVDPRVKFPRESHMTPEMARRMDGVAADKLRATGLAFP
ncbi:hypothetical protein PVAP13_4KG190900 [Panicum virgatum]|uniref:Sulfotransferase n=1 Tax=Panicum virgatum TaxID=38727 RepID=A0A8T0TNU7_PANVG|nr:hypothetical protein PVAP13_4KG190900 [Panicum virgatum]